ncbi:hypothetical protein CBL_00674 [Carabus blaptoides fortunei]
MTRLEEKLRNSAVSVPSVYVSVERIDGRRDAPFDSLSSDRETPTLRGTSLETLGTTARRRRDAQRLLYSLFTGELKGKRLSSQRANIMAVIHKSRCQIVIKISVEISNLNDSIMVQKWIVTIVVVCTERNSRSLPSLHSPKEAVAGVGYDGEKLVERYFNSANKISTADTEIPPLSYHGKCFGRVLVCTLTFVDKRMKIN